MLSVVARAAHPGTYDLAVTENHVFFSISILCTVFQALNTTV